MIYCTGLIMGTKPAIFFIKRFTTLLLFQALLLGSQAALANKLPQKFEANYALKMYGITLAEATHSLEQTDSGLSMAVMTRPVGLLAFIYDGHIDIRSDIAIDNGKLLLVNHDYTHSEDATDSTVRYEISRTGSENKQPADIVTGTYKGERVIINSEKPVWDPLSIQALIILNADNQSASYEHGLLMKGQLKHYIFENLGEDTISFNGTETAALKTLVKEAERDRLIYVWMLPEHHNIPVKYEHWKNGDLKSTVLLRSVTFENDGQTNTLTITHSDEEDENEFEDW